MSSYGGAWSTVPARSRMAAPPLPSPRGGEDRAPGAGGFAEAAGLAEAVLQLIARCGYESPTPEQRYAMDIAMAGRDLMACAQTGAAIYLPVVSSLVAAAGAAAGDRGSFERRPKPRALVLAPTTELAAKINEEAKKFSSQTGLRVVVAYGGTPIYDQLGELERGVDLLVAIPGCIVDMIERSKISLEAIKYLVMDEADVMLDMGLEPQIRKIVDMMNMPKNSVRQTMLFSASFPPEIQSLASDFLHNYITVGRVGSSTDLIEHEQSVGGANSKANLFKEIPIQTLKNQLKLFGKDALGGKEELSKRAEKELLPVLDLLPQKVLRELCRKHGIKFNVTESKELLVSRLRNRKEPLEMKEHRNSKEHYGPVSSTIPQQLSGERGLPESQRIRELELSLSDMEKELRTVKDAAVAKEQHLSNELSVVSKLADLYKESAMQWSAKAENLEGVIESVQIFLTKVEDEYKKKLEKTLSRRNLGKEAVKLKQKLEKCKFDLENTRKLIELTIADAANVSGPALAADVANVSGPALAADVANVSGPPLAACILRDSWSLAKMCDKYIETVDSLQDTVDSLLDETPERVLHEIK